MFYEDFPKRNLSPHFYCSSKPIALFALLLYNLLLFLLLFLNIFFNINLWRCSAVYSHKLRGKTKQGKKQNNISRLVFSDILIISITQKIQSLFKNHTRVATVESRLTNGHLSTTARIFLPDHGSIHSLYSFFNLPTTASSL